MNRQNKFVIEVFVLMTICLPLLATAQTTWHVDIANCPGPGDGSVGSPFCSIQDAINAAVNGDEILVAPGTYAEHLDLLGKEVALRSSGSADVTTIDGGGVSSQSVVRCTSGETAQTVIDGFTIIGGNADGGGWRRGGGIHIDNASPTVLNCVFDSNFADERGGGIYANNSNSVIFNCVFIANSAARGGGIYISGFGPSVFNCRFLGNVATTRDGGGAWTGTSTSNLVNCEFSGNSATERGGGMYCDDASQLTNCSFTQNSAGISGDGFRSFGSDRLFNCVFWGNYGGDDIDGSPIKVEYCDIEETTWPGTGNISSNPMFTDADGADNTAGTLDDDLTLLPGSPCIDAADTSQYIACALPDLLLAERFVDDPGTTDTGTGSAPIIDMGCYEYLAPPAVYNDCDLDNFPDECAIALLGATDCNGNGVPDSCEPDCDGDGIIDACEIAGGAPDCNSNGIPDDCDIASGFSLDCNTNGVPDDCDIASGFSQDCNTNGIPDDCDIASGFSLDCNTNGVPDDCDITAGTSLDLNTNGIPDECEGLVTVHVPTDYTTIQGAVDAIGPSGYEILVAPGVYNEVIDIQGKQVELRSSGGPAVTTLDGTGLTESILKLRNVSLSQMSVVDGFTFANGTSGDTTIFAAPVAGALLAYQASVTINDCVFSGNGVTGPGSYGGAVLLDVGEFHVTDCTFNNNSAESAGALGLGLANSPSSVSGSTFDDNHAADKAGAVGISESTVALSTCSFTNNDASTAGGAISSYASDVTFDGCTFTGNDGPIGGALVSYGPLPTNCTIRDCTFQSNTGQWGGAVNNQQSAYMLIQRTQFFENDATDRGGGFHMQQSAQALIMNSLFVGNSATNVGGAVSSQSAAPLDIHHCTLTANSAPFESAISAPAQVVNSIAWNNALPDPVSPSAVVISSNVEGGAWAGYGNMSVDPVFIDADGPDNIAGNADDDLHLSSGSPSIDMGDNNFNEGPDLDGNARQQHCQVDMGCYESPFFRDCNTNSVGDACDIESGTSSDLNFDFIPDDCQGVVTLTVPGMYGSIQEALVGITGPGYEIEVGPGVYDLIADTLNVDHAITIRSTDGPATTTINGNGPLRTTSLMNVTADAVIEGFEFSMYNGGSAPVIEGGGMSIVSCSPTIRDCMFIDCRADLGGAVYIEGIDADPLFENCGFYNNSATLGGAVNIWLAIDADPVFDGCSFAQNLADNQGGAIFMFPDAPGSGSLTSTDTLFDNNLSGFEEGDAIWGTAPLLALTNCTFHSSPALERVEWGGGDVIIDGCQFLDMTAVQLGGSTLAINNSTFNNASISASFQTIDVSGTASIATVPGTSVSLSASSSVTLNNVQLTGTDASLDGTTGLHMVDCTIENTTLDLLSEPGIDMIGCTLIDDAIVTMTSAADINIINTTLMGAYPEIHPYTSFGTPPSVLISNSTTNVYWFPFIIVQGSAPYPIVSIRNSIVRRAFEAQPASSPISALGMPGATFEYSNIAWYLGGAAPGAGNINVDPQFLDPLAGNLRLGSSSACINAASNALLPMDLLDLDGDGITAEPIPFDYDGLDRINGGTVDMGAFERTPPPNNTSSTPEPINSGDSVIASFAYATNDGSSSCDPGVADLFYEITIADPGSTLQVDTCGSGADTAIAVFDSSMAELACNTTCAGSPCAGPDACIEIPGLAADTYIIRVSQEAIPEGLGAGFEVQLSAQAFVPPCPADTNGDNVVDVQDLLAVLGAWGACDVPCPPTCDSDTNGDCIVDVQDLLGVLGAWGSCDP